MESERNGLRVYSIGHGNLSIDVMIPLLKQHNIKVLVDVRSVPYSRFAPDFNRESLKRSLEQAQIGYKFAGEYLGGRPKDPSCYRDGKVPDGKIDREDFLDLVDYRVVETKAFYQKGIDRLLDYAGEANTVVLCSEEDPKQCHRTHLIGHTLALKSVTLVHLRKDGTTQVVSPEEALATLAQQMDFSMLLSEPTQASISDAEHSAPQEAATVKTTQNEIDGPSQNVQAPLF